MPATGWTKVGAVGALLLVAGATRAADAPPAPAAPAAQAAPPAQAAPSIEPQAATTLKAALQRIAGAKSVSFRAEVLSDVALPSGEKVQFPGVLDAEIRRPDRMRLRYDNEQRSTHSWYDGGTYSLLSPEANTYASCPAPARLDDLLTQLRENYGVTLPLGILLREDVVDRVLSRVRTGHTVGRGSIGGVVTNHLAFHGDRVDWQIWIAAEGEPLVKRLVITWRDEPASPQFVATFTSWTFDAPLADAEFAFTPPPNAVRCEMEGVGK